MTPVWVVSTLANHFFQASRSPSADKQRPHAAQVLHGYNGILL